MAVIPRYTVNFPSPWDRDTDERRAPASDPFPPGTRARLRDDLGGGTVHVVDRYTTGCYQVRPDNGGSDFIISNHALRRLAPEWRPGDVVVVRFATNPDAPFTYVRGAKDWPGDRGSAKSDALMNQLYRTGRLTPVLQAGGEAFDGGRL